MLSEVGELLHRHNKNQMTTLHIKRTAMATKTLEYDGRNSAIKQLIGVLLTLGAKVTPSDNPKEEQTKMVRESLTTAFSEIRAGKNMKDARNLFA